MESILGVTQQLRSETAAEALARQGRPVVELLSWVLGHDPTTLHRRHAAYALGLIRDQRATDPLAAALRKDEAIVREASAIALGEIGDARGARPLVRALGDNTALVRKCAANALVCLGTSSVEPLIQELWDSRPGVREIVLHTLLRIGPPSVAPLINTMQYAGGSVSEAAGSALHQFGAIEELSRKVLADPRLTPEQKTETLTLIYHVLLARPRQTLNDHLQSLGHYYLNDESVQVQAGARAILIDLDRRALVRPSYEARHPDRQDLLRPSRGRSASDPPETLLRALENPMASKSGTHARWRKWMFPFGRM